MNRFFINDMRDHYHPGDVFQLNEYDAIHAAKVIRVKPGDSIVWMNGRGWYGEGTVQESAHKVVRGIIKSAEFRKAQFPSLQLVQAVLKNKSMEAAIQMCTQAGVGAICPVITRHCEYKKPNEMTEMSRKRDKWEKVAIEACKQSGNPWTPSIQNPMTLSEFLDNQNLKALKAQNYVASLHANGRSKLPKKLESESPIFLWIGPEGDFTSEEYSQLEKIDSKLVCIGENVFRSEVAALVMTTHFKNIMREDIA